MALQHRHGYAAGQPDARSWSARHLTSTRASEPVALRVTTAPAPVACKFHAIADRGDARSDKRESEALDLGRHFASIKVGATP